MHRDVTFRIGFFLVGDSLPFSLEFVRFRGRKRRPSAVDGDEVSSHQPESLDDVLVEPFDDDFVDDDSSKNVDASDDESSSLNSSRKLSNKCVPFITKSSHL